MKKDWKQEVINNKVGLAISLIKYYKLDFNKLGFIKEGYLGELILGEILKSENLARKLSNKTNNTKFRNLYYNADGILSE